MYEYDLRCLSRWRYRELKAVCRQYHDYKATSSPMAALIVECAKAADEADWGAILNNVTDGLSFERCASCQSKTQFYAARARFFEMLDKETRKRGEPRGAYQ